MRLLYMLLFFIPIALCAQKEVYIPFEWQQPNGLDYSFGRSAASGNFIIRFIDTPALKLTLSDALLISTYERNSFYVLLRDNAP